MILSFNLKGFECPPNMRGHLQKVLAGEYDIPLYGQGLKILDLGANCGAFAVWSSHRWPGSSVSCYEPHPGNFEILSANLASYPKVSCFNWGIGNPGLRALRNGKNNCGEASFHEMVVNVGETGQHVEVKDPLSLPEADILKMDIEGCEWEVLKPLIDHGRSFSAILLEFHNEELRREIEALLSPDYILTRCDFAYDWVRGTACYVNRRTVG